MPDNHGNRLLESKIHKNPSILFLLNAKAALVALSAFATANVDGTERLPVQGGADKPLLLLEQGWDYARIAADLPVNFKSGVAIIELGKNNPVLIRF